MKNLPTEGALVVGVTKTLSGVASIDPLFFNLITPVFSFISAITACTKPNLFCVVESILFLLGILQFYAAVFNSTK